MIDLAIMDRAAPPPAEIAALEASARCIETPCGEGTMTWRIWGEGEPLVLGHGATGSWLHWVRNIPALAARRMVIAADLPGHGASALPATHDHPGISLALAQGLEAILGPGGLPADLVGFSFGGVAFAWLAKLYPQTALRLILVGCGGLDTPHGDIRIAPARGLEGQERLDRLCDNLLGLMLHDASSIDAVAIRQLLDGARQTRLHEAPALVLPDKLLLSLPDVACPVDAIWGEHDRPHANPPVQEAALRRIKPDARFEVIAGAGHWAMFERVEAFNAVLLDYLGER